MSIGYKEDLAGLLRVRYIKPSCAPNCWGSCGRDREANSSGERFSDLGSGIGGDDQFVELGRVGNL